MAEKEKKGLDTRTSVVSNVTYQKNYQSHKGTTVHVFNVIFENGDKAEFSSTKKEQTKFVQGQSAKYDIWYETLNKTAGGTWDKYKCDLYRDKFVKNDSYTPADQDSIIRIVSLNASSEYTHYLKSLFPNAEIPSKYKLAANFVYMINSTIKANSAKGFNERTLSINTQAALKNTIRDMELGYQGLNEDKVSEFYPLKTNFMTAFQENFEFIMLGEFNKDE